MINVSRQKIGVAQLAIVMAIGCMAALFVLGTGRAHAAVNSWESIGGDLIPAGTTGNISMVMNNGMPYVAYMDNGLGAVKVMQYDGSGWEEVGTSPGSGYFVSLSFYGGAPYIAISDAANGYRATVKKFNGTDWELVGSPGFSPGGADSIKLHMDNGTPYVAFADTGNSYKPAVMKYNGSAWELVGSAGFAVDRVYDLSLYVDNDIPYVTYRVAAEDNKVPVMMYDGTDWVQVGGGEVARGQYPSLYIDNGNLYVSLKDSSSSFVGSVMMYNGSGWEKVGGVDFSSSDVSHTSLSMDNGTPYVAYADYLQSNKVTVKRYNGSSWETVGSAGFSEGSAESISLIIDNGIPYISYKYSGKVTVKKLVTRYNVIYNGNGHSGGSVPVDSGSHDSGAEAVVRDNTGSLVKTGHTFEGWNTAADGSGTNYSAEDTVTIGSTDVTLYAQWDINSYTVTYDGNGASSGSAPAGGSYVYNSGITIPGNTGGLVKTGHTFAGWNTAANGGGTDFLAGSTHTIGAADVTLYAQWTINSYTVSFNSNGGSSVNSQSVTYESTASQPSDPTRTGYTFAGWYADAGLTAAYDFATPIGAADVTLYATWTVNSYTVTHDDNGSESGSVPADSTHNYGTGVVVPGNPGGLAKTGYTLSGWNTLADGSGTNYAAGDTLTMGAANVTLYAQWAINSYTVKYDGNGSTGGSVPADSSHVYNTEVTVSGNAGSLAKTGYTFAGWNTEAAGSGTDYVAGDAFMIGASDVTLYAKWTINSYMVTYDGNGAVSGDVPADSSHVYNTVVTVPGNPGGLVKTGHTFAGWMTAADGSGTDYVAGDPFTIGAADVTLYAKWAVNKYTVSFESNGGSPVNDLTVSYGDPVAEPSEPTKTGYAFGGWYTDRGLTAAFDFASPIGAADVILYAKWLSMNALLTELSADQGTLRPAFTPSETNYAIDVEKSVTSLILLLSKGDPTQSMTVTGATYHSETDDVYAYNVSNLAIGPNPILITVTAENEDQNTYHLTVNVSANEAMGQPIALDPSVRTLTFPGGLAIRLPDELPIPPGATLTVWESNAVPSGEVTLSKAGQVIDFQFEGITIDHPVEITLGYDGYSDSSKLAIYYYNDSTGKWEYQSSQVTDNGITASVDHFSAYGVLADTTAPDRITVSAGEKTTSSITIHLAANDDSGVAKYMLYRDGALVAETADSTYVDTGLSTSRTYTYMVKAVDRLGNISNDSESITVTTIGNGGGDGSDNDDNGGVSNGRASAQGKVTSTDGTLTLPVGRSGEVRLGDEVKIVIPAGASDEELKITIKKAEDTQKLIHHNDKLLSPVFEILKNVAKNFSKDVTLTFAFEPTSFSDDQKPSIFFYDESKQVWVGIGGEINGNTITASVNHFTKFAVFAVGQETESTPDAEPTIRFSDIAGHWAEASNHAAVDAGIVKGYDDGTFKPDAAVTRAEFAVMLMNVLKPQSTGAELTFADTAEIGSWASLAVAQAVEAGIVTGYGDGSFRPAANITRAELAVMIARAYGSNIETDASAPTGFADDGDIPVWAKGAVAAVRQLGIVQGRNDGQFAPNATATRAEAVAMIMNLLHKMK